MRHRVAAACAAGAWIVLSAAARAGDDALDALLAPAPPRSADAGQTPEPEPEPVAYDETVPVRPAPEPTPTPAPRATVVEEIVVTAQKREQRLVDVPLNVSSLSGDDMRKVRVEQVRDVAGYIPNVDIKEQVPGAIPVVSIRGVGLDDFSSTNSPAAGIYVDQVPLSSLALMSFDLYDMERIEVLKGPQGTLYGRNSTAGAINVLSARPGYDREGHLQGGYGSYGAWDVEGMFNQPLGERFALRIAGKLIRQNEGFWKSRLGADDPSSGGSPAGGLGLPLPPLAIGQDTADDPIQRDIGERDILLGRMRAGWDVSPELRADLKLEGLRQRSELGQPEFFGQRCNPGSEPIDPDNCTDALGYTDTDRDPYRGDWRGEFPYDIDQWSATLALDWDFGWAALASVSGFVDLERFFHIDVDATPADQFDFFQTDTVSQFTQELRLAGSEPAFDWLAGVFWSSDDVVVDTDGRHQDLIPGEMSHIDADQTTRSAAAFVNADWRFAETLAATAGLRYTDETRDYVGGTTWTVEVPTVIESTFVDATIEDRNWSWKLGLNYTPTADSLIYGNVSKGVKSGGFFSGVTSNQAQLQPYKPEQLIAYEIGAKTQGRLMLNASAFWYDYKNVQVFMRSASAPVQLIGNVPEARVYGADFDTRWLATDNLTLQGGLGLLRTRLGSFPDPSGSPIPGAPAEEIPEGNRLANAPQLTFNGLARYELPFVFDLRAALQADAHYADEVFKEATNNELIRAEAYWIYNARVSLFPAELDWELAAWGRNLSDERYVVQGLNVGVFFFGNRNYNAPRTFGVEFSKHF